MITSYPQFSKSSTAAKADSELNAPLKVSTHRTIGGFPLLTFRASWEVTNGSSENFGIRRRPSIPPADKIIGRRKDEVTAFTNLGNFLPNFAQNGSLPNV